MIALTTMEDALIELYHTARVALADPTRHQRMCWAAREYSKSHSLKPYEAYGYLARAIS